MVYSVIVALCVEANMGVHKYQYVTAILFVLTILLIFCFQSTIRVFMTQQITNQNEKKHNEEANIPCKIQALDPLDLSLKPFLSEPAPLKCTENIDLFYVQENGILVINASVEKANGVTVSDWKCYYSNITRGLGDSNVIFSGKKEFKYTFLVESQLFRITCFNHTAKSAAKVYDMAFFNPYWVANKLDEIDDETEYKSSVILIGIDSLSRSNAIRSLPKTLQYLRDDLEAFDFMGLRKVGLNTFPNLIPLLTGRPHTDFPNYMQGKDFADSIPLIWKENCTARTATAFIEDCPGISMFNYLKPGFYKQPSEYYFRSFEVARRKFKPMIFTSLGKDSKDCYGQKNVFVLMKEYFKGFLKVYREKRKFALFWATHVGHDYVNHVRRFDEPLLEMLQWMKREINLENIMLIFFGDHGFRMGGLALTHIGREENNNHALIIHVPKQLKVNVENILFKNTARLVSHYDIYQTMYDIIAFKHIPPPQYMDVQDTLVRRNILNPIPIDRTCSDAGVPAEYCTCYEKISVDTNSSICLELGQHLVHHINKKILHSYRKCAVLNLYNISDVSLEYSDKHVKRQADQGRKSSWNNQTKSEAAEEALYNDGGYRMVIYTIPGKACFEGLLDYSSATDGYRIKVIGLPSRLNVYGNQSHCTETVVLKSFCYCKDL